MASQTIGRTVEETGGETGLVGGERSSRDMLIGGSSICIILGILALATYWAWIFSIFHASVLNPFGDVSFNSYLALCVVAAGASALSMVVFVLLGRYLQNVIDKTWFTLVLVALSALMGVPALVARLGGEPSFLQALLAWGVSAFSSSFVYLKTGPFFVWLKRAKLMRSIALAFLVASFLYLLTLFLAPVASIGTVMAFPAFSILCSHAVNRRIGTKRSDVTVEPYGIYIRTTLARLRDIVPTIPRTLLYTLVFGVTSCTVLNLAVKEDLVVIIGVSILVSSVIFAIYALSQNAEIDSGRYRTLLLPLIAIAVLPFPYVSDMYQIFFLALIVFGFTSYDAITWGDLADEIRDRQLPIYVSFAAPTIGNFAGIFVGWGVGVLLRSTLGSEEFGTGFAVFSIVAVIALVILLVSDLIRAEQDEVAEPHADAFLNKWSAACDEIAQACELTNQEKKIYVMLARGRNQRYIASELVISPHTVKTHTYHIYRKIGVHSQQELIDMVEVKM